MPGNKIRSKYKKKRKGFQNRKMYHGVHKIPRPGPSVNTYENKPSTPFINPKVTSDLSNMKQPESVGSTEEFSTPRTVSKRKLESHGIFPSKKKLALRAVPPSSADSKPAGSNLTGYRIINIPQFGEALNCFHACDEGKNVMSKILLHI